MHFDERQVISIAYSVGATLEGNASSRKPAAPLPDLALRVRSAGCNPALIDFPIDVASVASTKKKGENDG
ncbi:MAG: hypothetical protein WDN49_24175 [Acetobacteraceae bacterium]